MLCEREQLDRRIRCLARNRDAITSYLDELQLLIATDSHAGPGAEDAQRAEQTMPCESRAAPSAR
jgi:hypothetical protein